MSKENNNAKDAIKAYLDRRAADDKMFAVAYAKPGKSLDECFKYILGEARRPGSSVCMTDDEVFGLAVHYYDEDNIKISYTPANVAVSTSHTTTPAVKLSAKDKAAAKEAAIREYKQSVLKDQAEKEARRKKAAAERRRAKEPQYTQALFNFDEL